MLEIRPGAAVALGGGCVADVTDRGPRSARDGYDANVASHVGDDLRAVTENQERLRASLEVPRLVFAHQVHGAEVAVVGDELPAGVTELNRDADVLVTAQPLVAVAVVVADCLPILLADPGAGVIAAVHAGRPGLAAGVIPAALAEMARLGGRPDRCVALVGPGICGRCYEVPAGLRDEVAAVLPTAATTTRWDTPGLDLPAAAVDQLRAAGVEVRRDPRCTLESEELFSHRRDGRSRPTGRFAGWVVRR